jgi:hypothetical protein
VIARPSHLGGVYPARRDNEIEPPDVSSVTPSICMRSALRLPAVILEALRLLIVTVEALIVPAVTVPRSAADRRKVCHVEGVAVDRAVDKQAAINLTSS